jgi:hypothetical protein
LVSAFCINRLQLRSPILIGPFGPTIFVILKI